MNAFEILVIILSVFLGIFLIIGIVIGILLIKVTLQIRRVASTAERTASSVEGFMNNLSSASTGAFWSSMLMRQVKKFRKKGGN